MADFDQFANQGGAAAGDPEEAAAAQAEADELLKSASEADSADFGGEPLGLHAEPSEPFNDSEPSDDPEPEDG
jgi:hypothetical protein